MRTTRRATRRRATPPDKHVHSGRDGSAAAAPLCFAAHVRGLLARHVGTDSALPSIAFGGALVAAAFMLLSALSATLLVEGLGLREEAMPFVLPPLGMVLSFGWVLLASAGLMLGKGPLPRRRGAL